MQEEWRDIKGYEGSYQVSSLGKIKGLDRTIKTKGGTRRVFERIKSTHVMKIGYVGVNLSLNGKTKLHYVHRVIAQAFIPNPDDKAQVNHKDFDRQNNSILNLEWATQAENSLHAWTKKERVVSDVCACIGEDKPNSVLTNDQAKEIVRLLHAGLGPKEIAEKLNINAMAIYKISQGENWKHLGLDKSKCRNFRKRLSDKEVAIIRELYHQNDNKIGKRFFTAERLACYFSVGKTTIFNVIHGKNYPL